MKNLDLRVPVLCRELRLSFRQGSWRWGWRSLGVGVLMVSLTVVATILGPGAPWTGIQLVLSGGSVVLNMMPMGFAADRAAGQQALLRLCGLGPLRVFTESALGSLWVASQLGVFLIPVIWGLGARANAPPLSAFVASLAPPLAFLFMGSVWIFGAAICRSRSAAALATAVAVAITAAPMALEFWAGTHLPGWSRPVFHALSGLKDWRSLGGTLTPRGTLGPLFRLEARGLFWCLFWLSLAAWFYCRDWRRQEGLAWEKPSWQRWVRSLWTRPRRLTEGQSPYLVRFPDLAAWRWLRWVLAALCAGLGLSLAQVWSWTVLPVVLTVWVALVDMLAHLHVSGTPAEDRREGALELLLTTPLSPSEILEAGNQAGRAVVREGILPGLALGALLAAMAFAGFELPSVEGAFDAIAYGVLIAMPVLYGWTVTRLGFQVPVSQSFNTGEPYHAFVVPLSSLLLPGLCVGLMWVLTSSTPGARFAGAFLAGLVGLVILVARENFSQECPLDDEGLRTVAAAPLPAGEAIPKDLRTTKPWVPDGFRR